MCALWAVHYNKKCKWKRRMEVFGAPKGVSLAGSNANRVGTCSAKNDNEFQS
jgi:hypothetical protein